MNICIKPLADRVPSGLYLMSQKRAKDKHYKNNKDYYRIQRMKRYYEVKYDECVDRWLSDWQYTVRFKKTTLTPF